MLNLYEILEVSEKASKEVIEKAYHVLAKKYHPDLQEEENKKNAEVKMKQINEAYEILKDDEKRKQYDFALEQYKQEQEGKSQTENESKQNIQQEYNKKSYEIEKKESFTKSQNEEEKRQVQNIETLQREMKRAYANAYNDYLRSLGYKIKEPWTLKRFIELIKVLIIFAIIIAIIWFFPPTHKLIIEFYEENTILKAIVDIIGNIAIGLYNGIMNFFKNIF